MLRTLLVFLLLFVSSCALFKREASLAGKDIDHLLGSITMTGEGRGRLSLEKGSHLFSYEAVLKEDGDWLLAVSVPLHGEEVMVLPQIKEAEVPKTEVNSFEERLQRELSAKIKDGQLTGGDYIRELRALIRFVLAPRLSLVRECVEDKQDFYHCLIEDQNYMVRVSKENIFVRKKIKNDHYLDLMAQNLTESFFLRTSFHLHSEGGAVSSSPIFSLELFWK